MKTAERRSKIRNTPTITPMTIKMVEFCNFGLEYDSENTPAVGAGNGELYTCKLTDVTFPNMIVTIFPISSPLNNS